MDYVKKAAQAFLVGGLLSIMGQLFLLILTLILGSDSAFVGPGTLVLMGIFTLVTFPLGIYQKIEKFGGFGTMLTFTGLAGAVAGTYCQAKKDTGSSLKSAFAGAKLVVYVIGSGTIVALIVALIITFVL
jgi:SpoVAC/SpoVAEB sporulation membrane protein